MAERFIVREESWTRDGQTSIVEIDQNGNVLVDYKIIEGFLLDKAWTRVQREEPARV